MSEHRAEMRKSPLEYRGRTRRVWVRVRCSCDVSMGLRFAFDGKGYASSLVDVTGPGPFPGSECPACICAVRELTYAASGERLSSNAALRVLRGGEP